MDCEKFDQVAMSALYGELDELTSAAAKRHADTCPHCQATWSGLNATRKVGILPVVPLPAGFEHRILHAAREAQRHLPWPRRVSRAISWAGSYAMRPQTAMAAILLLMLGSSVIFVRVKPDRSSTPSRVRVTERGVPEQASEETRPAPPVSPEMRSAAPRSARREEERGGVPGTFAQVPAARDGTPAEPKEKAERAGELAAAPAAGAAANDSLLREGSSGRADEAARDDALTRSAAAAPVAQAAAPKDAYAAAMDLYTAGRYAEAERAFTEVAAAGNRNAASASLYAGKSAEAGVGCSRAAVKYELTASRYGATTPGAEALWAAANCYKANGNLDKARQLYLALRSVAGYRDRAEGELASIAAQRQQQIATRAKAGSRSAPAVQGAAASEPAVGAPAVAAPAAATKPAP